MERELSNIKKKLVLLKSYASLFDLCTAIKTINAIPNTLQISVLNKISDKSITENSELEMGIIPPNYGAINLELDSTYGIFDSPEMGSVFVIGPVSSLFLHRFNGRVLGEMTAGIYGILRGLGFQRYTAEMALNELKSLQYLLIIRGENDQLIEIQELLDT